MSDVNGYYVGVDAWQRVAWCDAVPLAEWSFIPRPDCSPAAATDPLTLASEVFRGLPDRWHRGLQSPPVGRWFAVFEVLDAEASDSFFEGLAAAATAFRDAATLALSYAAAADAEPTSVGAGSAATDNRLFLKPLAVAAVPYRWRSVAATLTRCGFDAVAATAEERRAICRRLAALDR